MGSYQLDIITLLVLALQGQIPWEANLDNNLTI